jgi:CHAT domain-containing protein
LKRDAATEQRIRDQIAAITSQRDDLQSLFASEFPDYAALSKPQPLTVKDIRALLADDEALVVVSLDAKSYVWAITRTDARWKAIEVSAAEVKETVASLRSGLDPRERLRPFDAERSFELYRKLMGPIEDIIAAKPRLGLVVDGALTSLPPQVLVTSDPTGKALREVDWLVRTHAVTVLPSIATLRVLRSKSAIAQANRPLIGFADPVFDRNLQNDHLAANVAVGRGLRGAIANIEELRTALSPLPDTAVELRAVAARLGVSVVGSGLIRVDVSQVCQRARDARVIGPESLFLDCKGLLLRRSGLYGFYQGRLSRPLYRPGCDRDPG